MSLADPISAEHVLVHDHVDGPGVMAFPPERDVLRLLGFCPLRGHQRNFAGPGHLRPAFGRTSAHSGEDRELRAVCLLQSVVSGLPQ